jgi:diguanylate cyclase (GGDEF)-like protein
MTALPTSASGDWSARRLIDFLAAVTQCRDAVTAVRTAIDVATEVFDAEVGAVALDGVVHQSWGFPADAIPHGQILQAVRGARAELEVPGVGEVAVAVAPLGEDGGLLVARRTDDPLEAPEVATLRGMSDVLGLVLETLRTVDVERALREAHQQALDDAVFRASHDQLTGLSNRQALHSRLTEALADPELSGVAVLFVDLDDFKTVNDSLGHSYGDELLTLVAERLRHSVREGDVVARLGGDEFAVLIEALGDEDRPAQVAERVLAALQTPFGLAGQRVTVNASVGIASQRGAATTDELLRDADLAMYEAKRRGKGRYAVYEQSMSEAVLARMALESDLRRALAGQELRAVYQPIVSTRTGSPLGFEALVRWSRPGYGEVSPASFIPAAEETGLVVPLDRWVLRTACRQVRAWQRQYDESLTLSVNLSAQHLHLGDVVSDTAAALASTGMPADRLTLEITESALLLDDAATRAALSGLKRLGVRIAIDDFGTGYSSLSYLRRFPVDGLKIDRSFVEALDDHSGDEPLVSAIVQLAATLGLSVVAEGVETHEQLAVLRGLGCEVAQGFLFDGPLEAGTAADRLGHVPLAG